MLKVKPEIFKTMYSHVLEVVDHYGTDFALDVYHLMTTTDKARSYIWLCRTCGTNLYPLPLDEYGKTAVAHYLENNQDGKTRFFRLTSRNLQELTLDQVKGML